MALEQLDDLYREIIMDHYRSPRNKRHLDSPSAQAEGNNPLCGDEVTLELAIKDGVIEQVTFQGGGCAISQASTSMLTQSIAGKSLEEAHHLIHAFEDMMVKPGETSADELGDLESLTGVKKFPVRVKCATLAWHVLEEALESYSGKGN